MFIVLEALGSLLPSLMGVSFIISKRDGSTDLRSATFINSLSLSLSLSSLFPFSFYFTWLLVAQL
jgi:hypothetical protein